MGRRDFFQKSDPPAVLNSAIREMMRILETLSHRDSRASVTRSINGLKSLVKSFDLKGRNMPALREQRKKKDRLSASLASHSFQRWTDDEDKIVMESSASDFDIGKDLGRSRHAVAKRRLVLKKSKTITISPACQGEEGANKCRPK